MAHQGNNLTPQWQTPIRILSFDGGGIRGLSSLLMLRKIMKQIAEDEKIEDAKSLRPADYFDLICGTSTGGLIAILLGRLRLTVTEAIDLYQQMAKRIFQRRRGRSIGSLWVSKGGKERYDARELEEVVKEVVGKYIGSEDAGANTRMYHPLAPTTAAVAASTDFQQDKRQCHTFVLAVYSVRVNNGRPHLFKTYDRHDETKIWEAARATTAATGFFEPMVLGNPPIRYVDAGLGFNNPSHEAYHEAKKLWPNREIGVFLSLGTGEETEASLPEKGSWFGIGNQLEQVRALVQLTTSATRVHEELYLAFKREPTTAKYFRFNVDCGLRNIGLDEWDKVEQLSGFTEAYFNNAEQRDAKHGCATRLRQLTSRAQPPIIPADEFTAVHEGDVDIPSPESPAMKYWYREEVGVNGYPDCVRVDERFCGGKVRPPGKTILSCRRIVNLQLRGQASGVAHGRYRVRWIMWFWAGTDYPQQGSYNVPHSYPTDNSVVERVFPPANPDAVAPRQDQLFAFPWDMTFSVGKAQRPGASFQCEGVDVREHPIAAKQLLHPGYQEFRLEGGVWNTHKNSGWCEFGDSIIDVDLDGHLAFVIARRFELKWLGGFSFGGVRLVPLPH
ncbi:acyl transferase/acyl hydrolase/lysophospholipase [Triangularia verruculosa]|uniref:Acyl transferase/acyl hydrolase/lysophospholipase n=1 Tax=Triangularia verruculosa TaxID=2587418 RepID=A0AAN7APH7_9PEZI|nr:acyl transferase/acyl hydrolase/lysophospholipase [Triangularia verruculosa]